MHPKAMLKRSSFSSVPQLSVTMRSPEAKDFHRRNRFEEEKRKRRKRKEIIRSKGWRTKRSVKYGIANQFMPPVSPPFPFPEHNTCCTIINSHGRREVWFNYCCQRVMHRLSRWLIRSYSISPFIDFLARFLLDILSIINHFLLCRVLLDIV